MKYNEIKPKKLIERVSKDGGSVGIYLTNLVDEKKKLEISGKSILDILQSVTKLKIFTERYTKLDKDRKLTWALLGHDNPKASPKRIVGKLFPKNSKVRVNDLLDDGEVNQAKFNRWVKDIRHVFIEEEKKLTKLLQK